MKSSPKRMLQLNDSSIWCFWLHRYSIGTGNRTFGATGDQATNWFFAALQKTHLVPASAGLLWDAHDANDRHLSLQESPRDGLRQVLVAYPVSSNIGGEWGAICPHKRALNRYGKCLAHFFSSSGCEQSCLYFKLRHGECLHWCTYFSYHGCPHKCSVRLLSVDGLKSERKNATVLKTSCDLSPNTCNSRCSKRPEKWKRGMFNEASVGNSELQEENRSIIYFVEFSSQPWPCKRQTSFRRSQAVTVKGATKPMGSTTLATKLKTNFCVTALLLSQEVLRLTTKVSLFWFNFVPKTWEDYSSNDAPLTLRTGSTDWSSSPSSKPGTLLMNLVYLKPPLLSNLTKSSDRWSASSGEWVQVIIYKEVLLNCLRCVGILLFMISWCSLQHVICASCWVFCAEDVSRVVIHLKGLWGVLPPQKTVGELVDQMATHLLAGTFPRCRWIDSANWCCRNLISVWMNFCRRSGPFIRTLFKETPWNLGAPFRILRTRFVCVHDQMMRQIQFCAGLMLSFFTVLHLNNIVFTQIVSFCFCVAFA